VAEAIPTDVIDALSDLFIFREVPGHIGSDDEPAFNAEAVQDPGARLHCATGSLPS